MPVARPDAPKTIPTGEAVRAPKGSLWADWQVEPCADTDRKARQRVDLGDFKPGAKPWSQGKKADDQALVQTLASEIDSLQNLFFADGRYKLLIVLQGTDTAGKDGTVRGVFSQTSPLGVRTVGWKAPTEAERDHDYLWRIHQRVPGAGEIMVFNRSHYEDVLVPVVNQWISPEQTKQRYGHINDFERLLTDTGTVVLKFMLHISFEEQRERLQERMNQMFERIESSLKQSFRLAVTEKELPAEFDAASRAALIVAYVIGRWHRFAKSGFRKLPADGVDSQLPALLV